MNANQLFGWRRLYLQGRLEPANRETPGLLAVRVVEGVREAARRRNASAASGTIQIELPKGRVRIVEIVDQTSLHTVLELVGSRTGAMLRRCGLAVAPRFLWECLNSRAVSRFPAPASSNPSCRFPAMGLPACFRYGANPFVLRLTPS